MRYEASQKSSDANSVHCSDYKDVNIEVMAQNYRKWRESTHTHSCERRHVVHIPIHVRTQVVPLTITST